MIALIIVIFLIPFTLAEETEFLILSSALIATTVWDLETTRAACKGPCVERNPLLAPLNHGQRYALTSALNGGVIWWAYKQKQEGRKYWWLYLTTPIAAHITAGFLNRGK